MYKVIAMFPEISGIERESFKELKDELGLIGNTSQDVGGIEIYYTNDGVSYAIAADSERYYGKGLPSESLHTNGIDLSHVLPYLDNKQKMRVMNLISGLDLQGDNLISYHIEKKYEVDKTLLFHSSIDSFYSGPQKKVSAIKISIETKSGKYSFVEKVNSKHADTNKIMKETNEFINQAINDVSPVPKDNFFDEGTNAANHVLRELHEKQMDKEEKERKRILKQISVLSNLDPMYKNNIISKVAKDKLLEPKLLSVIVDSNLPIGEEMAKLIVDSMPEIYAKYDFIIPNGNEFMLSYHDNRPGTIINYDILDSLTVEMLKYLTTNLTNKSFVNQLERAANKTNTEFIWDKIYSFPKMEESDKEKIISAFSEKWNLDSKLISVIMNSSLPIGMDLAEHIIHELPDNYTGYEFLHPDDDSEFELYPIGFYHRIIIINYTLFKRFAAEIDKYIDAKRESLSKKVKALSETAIDSVIEKTDEITVEYMLDKYDVPKEVLIPLIQFVKTRTYEFEISLSNIYKYIIVTYKELNVVEDHSMIICSGPISISGNPVGFSMDLEFVEDLKKLIK